MTTDPRTHPTSAANPPDDAWLTRVQGLIAKAESTEFPDEAEALLAKAQELMSRHAIDAAMLERAGRRQRDELTSVALVVEAPYATAKATLLGAVARANGCQTIRTSGGRGSQHCVLVGHASDLAGAQALYAALSVHAVRSMLAAPVPPHDTARRFRHAFLVAFAARIGVRLAAATRAATHEAEAATGGQAGLVLVQRERAVEQAVRQQFPRLRSSRISGSSGAGFAQGRRAADRAALGGPGLGGHRPGLPSG